VIAYFWRDHKRRNPNRRPRRRRRENVCDTFENVEETEPRGRNQGITKAIIHGESDEFLGSSDFPGRGRNRSSFAELQRDSTGRSNRIKPELLAPFGRSRTKIKDEYDGEVTDYLTDISSDFTRSPSAERRSRRGPLQEILDEYDLSPESSDFPLSPVSREFRNERKKRRFPAGDAVSSEGEKSPDGNDAGLVRNCFRFSSRNQQGAAAAAAPTTTTNEQQQVQPTASGPAGDAAAAASTSAAAESADAPPETEKQEVGFFASIWVLLFGS